MFTIQFSFQNLCQSLPLNDPHVLKIITRLTRSVCSAAVLEKETAYLRPDNVQRTAAREDDLDLDVCMVRIGIITFDWLLYCKEHP